MAEIARKRIVLSHEAINACVMADAAYHLSSYVGAVSKYKSFA